MLAADAGVPGEQPRVWLYRNKIMALNWYGMVREKLDATAPPASLDEAVLATETKRRLRTRKGKKTPWMR